MKTPSAVRDVFGVPGNLAVFGVLTGLTIGVVHALSPMTVWLVVWMAALGAYLWITSGPRERRWLIALLVVAVALRVAVVAGLFLWLDPNENYFASFSWDGDGRYIKRRAAWISNVWLGMPMLSSDFQAAFEPEYGWSSYLYVVAYVQFLMGLTPFGVHLFNVGLFVTAGVMMHRLARSAYGSAAALAGLALLLFMPSLIMWSSSALKESFHLLLISLVIVAVVHVVRASGSRRVLAASVLLASLAALDTLRPGALAIEGTAAACSLVTLVLARRASTAILGTMVLASLVIYGATRPAGGQVAMDLANRAVVSHIGNIASVGHGYKLLPQDFYNFKRPALVPEEAVRFAIRAVVAFVVVPVPWQVESTMERLFLPQQLVWYLMVLCAPVGFVVGLHKDPVVTTILAFHIVIGSIVIALNEGNIGTLVRHRDIVVCAVVWLSGLGGNVVLSRLASAGGAVMERARKAPPNAGITEASW